MEEKLKSVLGSLLQKYRNQLSLFLKTVLFAVFLFVCGSGGFYILDSLIFLVVATALYSRPLLERYPTKSAFFVLLPTAMISLQMIEGTSLVLPATIFFSVVFYLILGIKNFMFIRRSRLYYVSALMLFYPVFNLFFLADKSELFLVKYGLVFLTSYLLLREWLALISTFQYPERERVAALLGAFLLLQLLWATALLPIGFLNSANLMLLFTFVIAELLVNHFLGTINKNFLIQHGVFFGILFAIIYWTSSWVLKY